MDLNQYDIVGVDDGFSINIEHNDLADNVAESILRLYEEKLPKNICNMKHLKVSQKYISICRQIDSKNIQMLNIVAIL